MSDYEFPLPAIASVALSDFMRRGMRTSNGVENLGLMNYIGGGNAIANQSTDVQALEDNDPLQSSDPWAASATTTQSYEIVPTPGTGGSAATDTDNNGVWSSYIGTPTAGNPTTGDPPSAENPAGPRLRVNRCLIHHTRQEAR